MRGKRQVFLLLLTLCVCVGVNTSTVQGKVKKGKWRENISWTYNTKTKELVVSGNGKIEDCGGDTDGPAWHKFDVKKVRVTGKIKEIGVFFLESPATAKMTSLELPDSVEIIGNSAFEDASSLKRVRLPSNLKVIDENAFSGAGLEELCIPSSVRVIKMSAFVLNKNLKKVIFENGTRTIGIWAFAGCERLTEVKLPKTLKKIKWGSFTGTGLKRIVIPENVEQIERNAFGVSFGKRSPLKKVVIKSKKIKIWEEDIFKNANKNLVIQVPKSKLKEYSKALRSKGLPDYVKIKALS